MLSLADRMPLQPLGRIAMSDGDPLKPNPTLQAPAALLGWRRYSDGPDFADTGLDLVERFGWRGRVGDEVLDAVVGHHLVGGAIADLADIDRNALGDLPLSGRGAAGDDRLADGGFEVGVDSPAFAAGSKGEGEREQGQKRFVHRVYVGTRFCIARGESCPPQSCYPRE